jgi:GTPase SAR1 family protein
MFHIKNPEILLLITIVLLLLFGWTYARSQDAPNNTSQNVNSSNSEDTVAAPSPSEGTDYMLTILAAAVTAIITILGTWWLATGSQSTDIHSLRTHLDQAKKEVLAAQNEQRKQLEAYNKEKGMLSLKLRSAEEKVTELSRIAEKFKNVRAKLSESAVVRTYRQPVILVGPRMVGKTSLLMQWHAPWNSSRLDRTQTHYTSEVPVYDFRQENQEPHFADPEISVPVHTHLILKIHDFPGEPDAQKSVCRIIVDETHNLRYASGKNLGIVLICMFDATQAASGIGQDTHQYYNGELFRELRSLVAHQKVEIERLILVFNKYDKLKDKYPNHSDNELLRLCVDKFDPTYDLLHNVCNPEKVCEVFTMLSREEMHLKNRGAPIVLGEAARAFVRAFAGKEAENKVIEQSASNYASEKFL